ncbi:uncharacterized protein MELLADRAFT_105916 [Melampsora larici-populina 98AG31]|uniref:Uncharacterized protein n=1 Tax=Melampsora larici-populina (strain 98AG31 / pathotype 3-4-7) TaxID=747676 RepID=F4RJR6_MELLP|nr:uncharacterized protein MELLADRAFT_105916 [Melampsora larici-populina 98AG31]EGG07358.1 hypothetical protein MELLADRAFT_105916 [Melampsora larici-populina 98AG31]
MESIEPQAVTSHHVVQSEQEASEVVEAPLSDFPEGNQSPSSNDMDDNHSDGDNVSLTLYEERRARADQHRDEQYEAWLATRNNSFYRDAVRRAVNKGIQEANEYQIRRVALAIMKGSVGVHYFGVINLALHAHDALEQLTLYIEQEVGAYHVPYVPKECMLTWFASFPQIAWSSRCVENSCADGLDPCNHQALLGYPKDHQGLRMSQSDHMLCMRFLRMLCLISCGVKAYDSIVFGYSCIFVPRNDNGWLQQLSVTSSNCRCPLH